MRQSSPGRTVAAQARFRRKLREASTYLRQRGQWVALDCGAQRPCSSTARRPFAQFGIDAIRKLCGDSGRGLYNGHALGESSPTSRRVGKHVSWRQPPRWTQCYARGLQQSDSQISGFARKTPCRASLLAPGHTSRARPGRPRRAVSRATGGRQKSKMDRSWFVSPFGCRAERLVSGRGAFRTAFHKVREWIIYRYET